MINCPKCGADNMIGAIFCRTCGEKLNLNELSPDVFDAPKVSASVKAARILQRVLILVVVVGLVGLLAGLFWPVSISVTGTMDQESANRAQRKFQGVQAPSPRIPSQIPFTSDEATSVVNQALNLPSSTGGTRTPQFLSVEFLANGTCRLILKSVVFGRIPLYTTAIVRPTVATPGELRLEPVKVTAGKLPLPGPLMPQGLGQFTALRPGSVFATARSKIQGVAVTGGSCTITIRR